MTLPGLPSIIFLAILLLLLPWAAIRSARRLSAARAGAPGVEMPTRRRIWTSTLLMQLLLLSLAWRVGSGFDFEIFALPRCGLPEVAAAAMALAACLGLRALIRAGLSESERRKLMVYQLTPRTGAESALRSAAVLVASVAEEAAYRGVGFSILWYTLGNGWIAAAVSAIAFAVVHAVQGWRSVGWIVLFALVLQGLVVYTDTLVLAMAVHAIYDVIAGRQIGIEARRLDAEAGQVSG